MDESKLTLAQNADQTQDQTAESATEEVGGRELTEKEKVEKLKHELSLAQAEYQEAMAKIQEAEASGATKSSVAWLRSKAKKIGTQLANVSHELYWTHGQEEHAPREPAAAELRAELDQFVYEVNSLYEQNAANLASGGSMDDLVDEREQRRMRTGMRLLEAVQRDSDLAIETANAIKWDELAADIAYHGTQQLELDKPGEGRKKYVEFLKSRGMAAESIAEQLTVFDNGLQYARQRRNEERVTKLVDEGNVIEAIKVRMSDPLAKSEMLLKNRWLKDIVKEHAENLISKDLSRGVDFYRQMPDGAPGLRQVEELLYAKAEQMVAGFVDWEERKHRIKTLLADAPEALVNNSSGYYSNQNWTPDEKMELVRAIVDCDGHASAIARYSPSEIEAETDQGMNEALFGAYLHNDPAKLIASIGVFKDRYLALPEAEQTRVKQAYFDGQGKYYVTSRLQDVPLTRQEFAQYALGENQTMKDLIFSLEMKNPLALLAKCNSEHFALSDERKAVIFTDYLARKPFKILEELDSLDLNPEQSAALRDELLVRFADRFGQTREQTSEFFKAGKSDVKAVLANMREYVDPLLYIARTTGAEDRARMMGKGLDTAKHYCDVYLRLEKMSIPKGLFSMVTEVMMRSDDPKAVADDMLRRVHEIYDSEPFALKLVYEKSPTMAKSLLEGGAEERADFVKKFKMARENAGYMFRRLPPTAFERIFTYDEARAKKYFETFRKILDSPSQEIQKVAEQLADQISASEDPQGKFEQMESVFIRNNLPTVGKVFRIFELLHPPAELEKKLQNSNLSPTLRAERQRGRMLTIYKDLLNTHVESGNASLRKYLEVLQQGEDIMAVVDAAGVDGLDEGQKKSLRSFLDKLQTLYDNSMLGRVGNEGQSAATKGDLKEEYEAWRQSVDAKPGQPAVDRVAEMFFKPLGYESLDQVLSRMDQAKAEAGKRNEELAANGQLRLAEGDLLKGVDARFLSNIMQNGSVAKEFLGASSDSDFTPLDTDVGRVTGEDASASFKDGFAASPAIGYGDVAFLVRNRGQFTETSKTSDAESLRKKAHQRSSTLELFQSGVVSDRHYGIRTGFPMTQVDAMIAGPAIADDRSKLDSLCMQIVQNGFYVPVADRTGKILFTPEAYREFQEKYNVGLERLGGKSFELQQTAGEVLPEQAKALDDIKREKRKERESIEAMTQKIQDAVFGVLEGLGVQTYGVDQNVAIRPELLDTGSSGRGTNIPGSYDFDFVLKLNPKDMIKSVEIQNKLMKILDATDNGSHEGQLRMKDGKLSGIQQKLEIDIAFVSKSDLAVYESHDASKERLDAMQPEVREEVQANIVLAKKILKEAGVYKKTEGGLGGIGMENFILQNGGNVVLAFQRFDAAAHAGDSLLSFAEFKQKFKIIDPGINAKFGKHDNFVEENMNEDGYRRMADAVKEYLRRVQPKNMQEAAA